MYLKRVNLVNFRNYAQLLLDFSSGINIIYGENAQGKTNLLESIYLLAVSKSHRSLNDLSLINNNASLSKVSGLFHINDIDTEFKIILSKNSKQYFIDNDKISLLMNYISKIKVIIFFPDDLEIIKGSPLERRRYINLQVSQLNNEYFKLLSEFNKLLKIRNNLLKEKIKSGNFNSEYFNIITNYLIDNESSIYYIRKKYISKVNEKITNIFYNLSGIDNFKINYIPNTELDLTSKDVIKEQLLLKYKNIYNIELRTGTTMIGPHRDDLSFMILDKDLKTFGSQGQQRIAVLSLKLAEIDIFSKYSNDKPILLLDDVFSELDDNKKNNLLKYINSNIQTIITTTELSNLDKNILINSKLIKICDGKVIGG